MTVTQAGNAAGLTHMSAVAFARRCERVDLLTNRCAYHEIQPSVSGLQLWTTAGVKGIQVVLAAQLELGECEHKMLISD